MSEIKVGKKVRHKTGGPIMRVSKITEPGKIGEELNRLTGGAAGTVDMVYTCKWWNDKDEDFKTENFSAEELEIVDEG